MPSKAGAIRAGRAYIEAFIDASQVEKDLGKLQDKLRRFSGQVQAIGGSLVGVGTAILVPMAAAVKAAADAGSELAKLSDQTGETVEDLSRLQFAANQTGVDFDDLVGAAEELNIRLGEAAREGTGPLAETLLKLGLDARELIGLPLPERLAKIAEAINSLPDNAARGFAADEIFGGDAFKILPLLSQGEEGIRKLGDRAEELGKVMNQKAAEDARELSKSLNELMMMGKALVVTIGTALIPEATSFSKFMTETVPEIREWIGENRELIVTLAKLGAFLATVGGGMILLGKTVDLGASSLKGFGKASRFATGHLGALAAIAATAFLAKLAIDAIKSSDAFEDLNKRLKRSIELEEELQEITNRRQNAKIDQARNIKDLEERRKFLEAELAISEKNSSVKAINLDIDKQRLDAATSGFFGGGQDLLGVNAAATAAREQIAETEGQLEAARKREKQIRDELKALSELEQNGGRSSDSLQKTTSMLEDLRKEVDEFGLSAGEKFIRKLEELRAGEEELAEARKLHTELTKKQAAAEAEKEAAQEAARNQDSIEQTFQSLKDDIADLQLPKEDRELASFLREIQNLGASTTEQEKLKKLFTEREALLASEQENQFSSFTAQGGTFSALAGRIFTTGANDPQKKIAESTAQTAKNTKTIANNSGPVRYQ